MACGLLLFALAMLGNAAQNSPGANGQSISRNGFNNDRSTSANHPTIVSAPSDDDVKAWVKDYEDEINPVGGVGSPMSISLTFHQIQYGEVRSANEGDRLRHVKSDQLYMVIVDYTVNQKFSDGTYPKNKKWKFEFYVNTEDGWSAFSYGPDQ